MIFLMANYFLQAMRLYPLLWVIVSPIRAACKVAVKYLYLLRVDLGNIPSCIQIQGGPFWWETKTSVCVQLTRNISWRTMESANKQSWKGTEIKRIMFCAFRPKAKSWKHDSCNCSHCPECSIFMLPQKELVTLGGETLRMKCACS